MSAARLLRCSQRISAWPSTHYYCRVQTNGSFARYLANISACPSISFHSGLSLPARTFTSDASSSSSVSASSVSKRADMMCFQCEQTRDNVGCKTVGVCGKLPSTAAMQDAIMHVIRGIGLFAHEAIRIGGKAFQCAEIDHYVMNAAFSTMTNVNFDDSRMMEYLKDGIVMRDKAKGLYVEACKAKKEQLSTVITTSPFATWMPSSSEVDVIVNEAKELGIVRRKEKDGDDIVGLQELIAYGLKGTLAYAHHATTLGKEDPTVFAEMHRLLAIIANPRSSVNELLDAAMDCGKLNLQVMSLLDAGHTERFGDPSPYEVNCKPVPGKCILVSGHDLLDLKDLLEQTKGTGINIYTHGEMLPAHGYPELRKYPHLVGNFGGAWQLQKFEFASFPGPIVMTSNCIIEPGKAYKHRIWTMNVVGWPGVKHLKSREFKPVIEQALREEGFNEDNLDTLVKGPLTVGFARKTIMSVADKVLDAVKSGALKRIAFIGGCDGTEGERNYFTKLATALPKESVVLTAGCGKHRVNRVVKGDIGGIPRVLDMGQCNDAFSGIQVAVALANALKTDVNSLPLSFAVSWLEQKAVAVLLTLLHLNIKNIHLGPALPAFATPTMMKILNEKFGLQQVNSNNPAADVQLIMAGK